MYLEFDGGGQFDQKPSMKSKEVNMNTNHPGIMLYALAPSGPPWMRMLWGGTSKSSNGSTRTAQHNPQSITFLESLLEKQQGMVWVWHILSIAWGLFTCAKYLGYWKAYWAAGNIFTSTSTPKPKKYYALRAHIFSVRLLRKIRKLSKQHSLLKDSILKSILYFLEILRGGSGPSP